MKTLKTTRCDVSEHLHTPEEMAAYLEACFEEAGDTMPPSSPRPSATSPEPRA